MVTIAESRHRLRLHSTLTRQGTRLYSRHFEKLPQACSEKTGMISWHQELAKCHASRSSDSSTSDHVATLHTSRNTTCTFQGRSDVQGTSKDCLYSRLRRQLSARILVYSIYTKVLGSGVLLRSTDCIPAVVRAVLPCTNKKSEFFEVSFRYPSLSGMNQRTSATAFR